MNNGQDGWAIRQATHVEATAVAAMVRDSFQDVAARFELTPQNCPSHPSNCVPEWIERSMGKGVIFYVVESDGRLCGSVGMTPSANGACKMISLAVLSDRRRSGLGRALVGRVLEQAASLGLARVEIAIIAKHAELRRWYEKLGFIWDRTETFEALPFEVGFMRLDLHTVQKVRTL